ncbi:MAG: sigma-70 family RNA polymerase sigma factor [Proteobacteria bacterium]|nr:sigma-70 family RNA polymerase sigma factor [Pseudomonadota bacterium]
MARSRNEGAALLRDDWSPAQGHREARITQVLESLRPELARFATWLAGDRSIAEEVVQEAMLRAWRARDSLKDLTASRAWLLTIARREYARLFRRKRLDLVSLEEWHAIDSQELEAQTEVARPDDEFHDLRAAILKLPIDYREPLILQVMGGLTATEIASELGLSLTAVLTRLFRARNKLRVLFGEAPAEGTPDPIEAVG